MHRVTLRNTTAILLAGFFLFGGLTIGAHPGNDDPVEPFQGNTFTGPLGPTRGEDGLQDLWDADGDGRFDSGDYQYDRAKFRASSGSDHDYQRPLTGGIAYATMLRQPVDFESPGLIFWDWTYDWDRRTGNRMYDTCEFQEGGALAGPSWCRLGDLEPTIPYKSALHYHDILNAYVGALGFNGGATGNPCAQTPGPMWNLPTGPIPRPDNPDDVPVGDPLEPGSVGDTIGELPFADKDNFGYFDAVENLQTTPTSFLVPQSAYRWHVTRDNVGQSTDMVVNNTLEYAAQAITGAPNGILVSPGHDGFVFARFQNPVIDGPGPDIRVHEASAQSDYGQIPYSYYCVFGSMEVEGPYYLIGTAYGQGPEDFDLAHYYNAPGAIDKGGPAVKYVGIMTGVHNMHRLTADFTWTPDVRPALDANGNYVRPIAAPVAPVRNESVTFIDTSTRHGHPTWMVDPQFVPVADHMNEDADPIKHYRWTFNDPTSVCRGPTTYASSCITEEGTPVPGIAPDRIDQSQAKQPTHKFGIPGVYNVCHTVMTDGQYYMVPGDNAPPTPSNIIPPNAMAGAGVGRFTDTVCKDVPVWNYDPTPIIHSSRVEGCVPDLWRFWADYTDPENDNITNYEWTFEDGGSAQGAMVEHQFPASGTYRVDLKITDKFDGFGKTQRIISTYSPENKPPVLHKIPGRTVMVGTELEFHIKGLDVACDDLTYAYYGLPEGAVMVQADPPVFRWKATEAGRYENITYMVSDGTHQVSDTTWVQVVEPTIDEDGDGAGPGDADNCPGIPNREQLDADGDGIGDACDTPDVFVTTVEVEAGLGDVDGDGVGDAADNCPIVPNAGQFDLDRDGLGDLCDTDLDGDGIVQFVANGMGHLDNCPFISNPDQADANGDGPGDACDPVTIAEALAGSPGGSERNNVAQAELAQADGPIGTALVVVSAVLVAALLAGVVLTAEGIRHRKLHGKK